MSFNYVGYIGHIWFRADANGRLRKVDFAKYINGEKNFDCETPYGISRQENRKKPQSKRFAALIPD